MNRDPELVQHELDAAQADLQRHLGELKHIVEDKLERPRQMIAAARRPFAWLDAHAVIATFGAFAAGVAYGLYRTR